MWYKVAIFALELRKCTARTRLVLQDCRLRVRAAEVYVPHARRYIVATVQLQRKCASRVLDWRYNVTTRELELRNAVLRTPDHSTTKQGFSSSSCRHGVATFPPPSRHIPVTKASYSRHRVVTFPPPSRHIPATKSSYSRHRVVIFPSPSRRSLVTDCDIHAGVAEVCCVCYSCGAKLRFSRWSCGRVFAY